MSETTTMIDAAPSALVDHDEAIARAAQEYERLLELVDELTGPAGGRFAVGDGGPEIEVDAVEFCRILSGRERGDGLLTTPVIF